MLSIFPATALTDHDRFTILTRIWKRASPMWGVSKRNETKRNEGGDCTAVATTAPVTAIPDAIARKTRHASAGSFDMAFPVTTRYLLRQLRKVDHRLRINSNVCRKRKVTFREIFSCFYLGIPSDRTQIRYNCANFDYFLEAITFDLTFHYIQDLSRQT